MANIIRLYDIDTGAYDIDRYGDTVSIYGAAFFKDEIEGVRLVKLGLMLSSGSSSVNKVLNAAADEVEFLENWNKR